MAVEAGQDVGRYHIIEALGQGGMATVYKAYDTRLEREVAIKFIRVDNIEPSQLAQTLKRFEREGKALAKFLHPNIVPVMDYGEHEGVPYVVMAYLPGGTLKVLTGKPMPYDRAARLLAPVARALEYAHRQNIVHRDVKPGNILLTAEGTPMLSDFGIAKMLGAEETTQLTTKGISIGTPEYMAPEQWQGKVVPQSDIYALGVVFYELVTGRKPYTADTPAAILLKQATETLPPPRMFVPNLPEEVERVLNRALAKEVANRYASMAEFAAVLERLGTRTSTPTPLPLGEGRQAPFPTLGARLEGGKILTVGVPPAAQVPAQRAVPPTVPTQSQSSATMNATGRSAAGRYVVWAGIGIVALCLVGVVVAVIVTQVFGLLKTQTTGIQTVTQSVGLAATTPATLETMPQSTLTETAVLTAKPTATALPPTPVAQIPADKLAKKGRLLICSDFPYPPQEFFDGNGDPQGVDVEIGQEIGVRLGLKVEFVNNVFDTIIDAVIGGKCDIIISGMTITTARQKKISQIPYFQSGQAFLAQKGNPFNINGPMDLCGKTVAAESGTTEADYLQGTGDYQGKGLTQECVKQGKQPINVVVTQNDADALQGLQVGKVVVYSTDSTAAAYDVLQHPDQFQLVGQIMEPSQEGIGVPCGAEDCTSAPLSPVGQAVQAALKSMMADGTYARILAKWNLSSGAVNP